jgi:disulfide bond formation protein DsbB
MEVCIMNKVIARVTIAPIFRPVPFLLGAGSSLALGVAYAAQYGFGLEPSGLCLLQRWPYGAAIALGIVAHFMPSRRLEGALLLLMALAFLANSSIAFFQVGVEQQWWSSHVPSGPATVMLFGLSMAACNGLYAFTLSLFAMSEGFLKLATPAPAVGFGAAIARRV